MEEQVTMQNSVGDRAPPVVAEFDFALVEPKIVAALLQVGLDTEDQFLVSVVSATQGDAHRLDRFGIRDLSVLGQIQKSPTCVASA